MEPPNLMTIASLPSLWSVSDYTAVSYVYGVMRLPAIYSRFELLGDELIRKERQNKEQKRPAKEKKEVGQLKRRRDKNFGEMSGRSLYQPSPRRLDMGPGGSWRLRWGWSGRRIVPVLRVVGIESPK